MGAGWEDALQLEHAALIDPDRAMTVLAERACAGIDAGEFSVVYQAVVDAQTARIDGFEALARWRRPDQGVQGPDAFLGALQRSGRLAPLTDFVLATACAAASTWPACGGRAPRLRVNVCATELDDPELGGRVRRALSTTGLRAEQLVLEVAAGGHVDPLTAQRTCAELGDLGIGIALDAYGADDTALNRVRELPCTEIKLAKALVQDVVDDPEAAESVGRIVALARSLSLPVTLDGIENAEQLPLLLSTLAPTLQGFHLGRPASLTGQADVLAADVAARALVTAVRGHTVLPG